MKRPTGYKIGSVFVVVVAAIVLGGRTAEADGVSTTKADVPTARGFLPTTVLNGKTFSYTVYR